MMNKTEVIKDLSSLTSLSATSLRKTFDKVEDIICHAIYEAYLDSEDIAEIDLGIGTLIVLCDSNNIKYKFQPSERLENAVVDSINNNKDVLISDIEESLKQRIINTYKELF